jgi:aspartyl-tRNA(Asn)/glutamyl-tRNA(Gln) amidotransferase subunit B
MTMAYEAVIGLEIHVQLNCETKMFCDCPNRPGDRPNMNTCPICLWMPGALPQFSQNALEQAALTALALNCTIQPRSAFDQKVYYYPDLPKGFQLSQHHKPLARNGWLDIIGEDGAPKRLRIHHMHMEEDVAKLVHETEGRTRISLVDFNRAGSPLVEIVTEPDMRSAYDAMEFLRVLRRQIRYAGTAECSMDSGTMRCDANISIRPAGSSEMNTKVEVKNMNSVRAVGSAIDHEIMRQTEDLDAGRPIVLHTRLWDPDKNITTPMRGKFAGPCLPDPSVPAIVLTEEWVADTARKLHEMPAQKQARFVSDYGLLDDEAAQMSAELDVAEYFEAVVAEKMQPRTAAQWIAARLMPVLREKGQPLADATIPPQRLAALMRMVEQDKITAKAARQVFDLMFATGRNPEELVEEHGFSQLGDSDELTALLDTVLAEHADAVENYRKGKTEAAGFLIGQAMRISKGKANPKLVREMIEAKLAGWTSAPETI